MSQFLKQSLLSAGAAFLAWIGVSFFRPGAPVLGAAASGLALSWGISTASLLILSSMKRFPIKKFLWAWAGGIGIRFLILAALMAAAWNWPASTQAALLLSYAFGVFAFLMIESRPLVSREVSR